MGIIELPYAVTTGTGATALANWVDDYDEIKVKTQFGTVFIQRCRKEGIKFWHVNRHCATRRIKENAYRLAHLIKHSTRASYILALATQGVKRMQAISCVGTARSAIDIRHIVLPNNYLTPTWCKLSFSDLMPDEAGPEFYREWQTPFDALQRRIYAEQCRGLGLTVHDSGILDIVPGPQLETDADMTLKRSQGVSIVGMATALPESPLAGELGIFHQPACIVTDFPDKPTTQAEIEAVARELSPIVFQAAFNSLQELQREDGILVTTEVKPVAGLREKLGLS